MLKRISLISFVFTLSFSYSVALSAQLSVQNSDTFTLISLPSMEPDTLYPDLHQMILKGDETTPSFLSIDKNHVFTHYGFFCKEEAKRDKKSKVPVRLRLGTLDQVNQKEYGN